MKVRITVAFLALFGLAVMSPRSMAQTQGQSSTALSSEKSLSTNPQTPGPTSTPAVAAPTIPAPDKPAGYISPWLTEVVKLNQAKVDEGVILTYIDSAGTFNLGAEQIIYLRDRGIPNSLIGAILEHDYELLSGLKPIPNSLAPSAGPSVQPTLSLSNIQASATVVLPPHSSAKAPSFEEAAATDEPPMEQPCPIRYCTLAEPTEAPPTPTGFSPVRTPYAVKLTDPIIMVRGGGRLPNRVVIDVFP